MTDKPERKEYIFGAPSKEPEDFNEDWKQDMLEAYTLGKSDAYMRTKCFNNHVVSNDLWYRWREDYEDFSETVKFGRELSRIWWENTSQEHASGENTDANAVSLSFNMTNRFKDVYKMRQEVTQSTKVSLDIDELDKLQEFLAENGVDVDNL